MNTLVNKKAVLDFQGSCILIEWQQLSAEYVNETKASGKVEIQE